MNTSSVDGFSLKKDGVLKKTRDAVWTINKNVSTARSDAFSSEGGLNCLVLMNESGLPENMMKFKVWLYTRAIVNHTLEVSLSFLDDKNRQCYAVEKCLSNSTTETSKVCATVDFSRIRHPPPVLIHNGALKIRCSICVDTSESMSSGLKPSREDFKKFKAQLQLENIVEAGSLTVKVVYMWAISQSIMKSRKVEVRSDKFTFESSEFCFSKLNILKEQFEVCLNRKSKDSSKQNIRMTLAVLDNRGITHYAKEEVTQGSSKVFLNYGKVFKDRGMFLDKGELKIYCSLQIDNSSTNSDIIASKPGGSSETSRLTTVSSQTENAADVETYSSDLVSRAVELTPSPGNKLFSKSVGNPAQKLVAENSILIYSKAEGKSEIQEELNEMLQLLYEARVDTVVIVYKKRTGTS